MRCNYCNKPNPKMLACGQCNNAIYCGASCQSQDWSQHAPICLAIDDVAENLRFYLINLVYGSQQELDSKEEIWIPPYLTNGTEYGALEYLFKFQLYRIADHLLDRYDEIPVEKLEYIALDTADDVAFFKHVVEKIKMKNQNFYTDILSHLGYFLTENRTAFEILLGVGGIVNDNFIRTILYHYITTDDFFKDRKEFTGEYPQYLISLLTTPFDVKDEIGGDPIWFHMFDQIMRVDFDVNYLSHLILKYDIKINQLNDVENNVLQYSLENNLDDIDDIFNVLSYFKTMGLNLNNVNFRGQNLLYILIDYIDEVKELIDMGIDPFRSLEKMSIKQLVYALNFGQTKLSPSEKLEILHETAMSTTFRTIDFEKFYVLHQYCILNNYDFDINYRNHRGKSFLVFEKSFLNYLIKNGYNINARDNEGKTALFYAYDKDMVSMLLEAGADMTIRANDGQLPINKRNITEFYRRGLPLFLPEYEQEKYSKLLDDHVEKLLTTLTDRVMLSDPKDAEFIRDQRHLSSEVRPNNIYLMQPSEFIDFIQPLFTDNPEIERFAEQFALISHLAQQRLFRDDPPEFVVGKRKRLEDVLLGFKLK